MAKKGRHKVQFCPQGHDTFVTGRDNQNRCIECHRHPKPVKKIRKQICSKGHDKNIVGVYKDGKCKVCVLERCKERHAKNKDFINDRRNKKRDRNIEEFRKKEQEYRAKNIEEISLREKKWKKEHPELVKALKIKQQTNRNLCEVAWTDWDNVIKIYKNCPLDMETDHYIPLQGKGICGLHVSWNLQYLTPEANRSKNNKCDKLEASEWYGKILEEVGLK